MKKSAVAVLAVGAFALGGTAPAMAHDAVGLNNCRGEEKAFFAQAGKPFANPGIGNIAPFLGAIYAPLGTSPKELSEFVRAHCAGLIP